MEDDNFGVYSFYFNLLRNLGTFPYSLDSRRSRLSLCKEGPFLWLYYVNFAAAVFHAVFQASQLLFLVNEGSNSRMIIGQITWVLLSGLPISNMIKSIGEEQHFAAIVNEWCQLERQIIGSAFRGLAISNKDPLPSLSTCHYRQTDRFNFISRYYIFLGMIGAGVVGTHCYLDPKFPAYLYSLCSEESDVYRTLSIAFQLYIYMIIWSNVYEIEVLATVMSSSVGHILETLSYRGGVVMTRWTCDHIPVLDLVGRSNGEKNLQKTLPGSPLMQKANRKGSAIFQGAEDLQEFFPNTEISKVIQNLVDIEYGLDGYLRVESLIEGFNHSFGRMIPGHQFVYLIMLTIQGFNMIQYFSRLDPRLILLYTVITILFLLRMMTFFPAMGNLDHRSDSFIDSWMEGLRYIPKGKQSYELYWYKIKSCRLLDFRCGRYFNMERQSSLEFLFRVSEFVIVLMQIWY